MTNAFIGWRVGNRRTGWAVGLALLLLATPAVSQQSDSALGVVMGSVQQRLEAVGARCDGGEPTPLRYALLDPVPAVRQLAIVCWIARGGPVEELDLLAVDPDESVRITLSSLLSQSDARGRVTLWNALVDDPAPGVRAAVAAAVTLDEPSQAAELLRPLLHDTDLLVVAEAVEAVERNGALENLSSEDRQAFEAARPMADLRRRAPELIAALTTAERRTHRVAEALLSTEEAAESCGLGLSSGLEAIRQHIRGIATAPATNKPVDRLALVASLDGDLRNVAEVFELCRAARLVELRAGPGRDLFAQRHFLVTTEIASSWTTRFGLLRADLTDPRGGELWSVAELGVDAFLPGRPGGFRTPVDAPALDLSTRLRRDQLIRNDELSAWAGGGLISGRLPHGCGGVRRCTLGLDVLGERSSGHEDDFPSRLVAGHRAWDGALSWEAPIGSTVVTIDAGVDRVRYENSALEPAGMDRVRARVGVDSAFQLMAGVRRTAYPVTGPVTMRDEVNAVLDRDGTFLDGLAGVRFGPADPTDSLNVVVLGGVSWPSLDDFAPKADPSVIYRAALTVQSGGRDGDLSRFRLVSGRRVESSPRDFALQNITQSVLEYVYQGVDLPDSGVRFSLHLTYELAQHVLPLTPVDALDLNRIAGGVSLRVLLAEWIGLAAADEISAVGPSGERLGLANRFDFSMFLPLGGYDFGLAEDRPW